MQGTYKQTVLIFLEASNKITVSWEKGGGRWSMDDSHAPESAGPLGLLLGWCSLHPGPSPGKFATSTKCSIVSKAANGQVFQNVLLLPYQSHPQASSAAARPSGQPRLRHGSTAALRCMFHRARVTLKCQAESRAQACAVLKKKCKSSAKAFKILYAWQTEPPSLQMDMDVLS